MGILSAQGSDDGMDGKALRRRIEEVDQSLEQALVTAEDAQEQARLLAEERAAMERELAEERRQTALLRRRLAVSEAEAAALREALGRADVRLRTIRRDETHLNEERQTSYEELQVLTEELARANTDLELRVDARTAELAEANAALRTREEQLRFAQKCAGAGAWDWDLATNTVTWSPECYDLMGIDRDDGRPPMDLALSVVVAEDRPVLLRMLENTRDQTDDEFRVDFRIHHAKRGVRWIASLGRVAERDPAGRPARATGLALDLTDRKAIEESLRHARDAAESANRAKTSFLAAASHDLRQPIQAAALYAHVLRASIGATNPDAVEALDLLKGSIESLNGMLSGLLDLSRLEAGAVDVAITNFAPDDLMARLCAEFGSVADAAEVDLRCVRSSLAVATDSHLLERVLRNFLSNAITHGKPNGDRKARGRVLLGCRRRGQSVEFQVWDNGPGIPPEARGAIFEEFRQLKNPERNAAQGFGLGLSIVARIARLLGLEVSVRSEVGRGSVFSVAVPQARRPAPAAARARAPAILDPAVLAMLKGRTVLLVEDDERIRRGLTLMLTRWGVRVVAVASAEELATRLPRLRTKPHVLLTDYRLPGGSTGRTVVELVRDRWDVPGIIITGDTAPDRLREAKSLGCRLLHKPVEPAELVQTLGEVLHHA